jgi:WD40 repeat protein
MLGRIGMAVWALLVGFALHAAQTARINVETGHSEAVTTVAFSPNGRFVLTGSNDNSARAWDLKSRKEVRRFVGHSLPITSLAVSPDGRYLVTGSYDKTFILWDFVSGQLLRRFYGHRDAVQSVAFSPDGSQIVTGSFDHTARIWQVGTGLEVAGHPGLVKSAVYSADGKFVLLTAENETTVVMWEVSTGAEVRRFEGHTNEIECVAVSPDGRLLATASRDGTARIWELSTGHQLQSFDLGSVWVRSVAFSPDSKSILTGGAENVVRLWNVSSGKEYRRFTFQSLGSAAVSFSHDGRLVIAAFGNGAQLWDSFTGLDKGILQGEANRVEEAIFSRDGKMGFIASHDSTPGVWNFTTGRQVQQFTKSAGEVMSLAVSPDGAIVAVGKREGRVQLLDSATGSEIRTLSAHRGAVSSIAFSPDGKTIATGGFDRRVRLWDARTGQQIRTFQEPDNQISLIPSSVAFSSDRSSLLIAGWSRSATQWDIRTGSMIRQFLVDILHQVSAMSLSSDGQLLLTASQDQFARLWNANTGQEILRYDTGSGIVTSVAISSDNNFVLTGNLDGSVRLWDSVTGKQIRALDGHTDWVSSVAFSADNQLILTSSYDGTTRLWNTSSGIETAKLVSIRDGGWAVVSPDGRFDTSQLDGGSALYWIVDDQPLRPLPLEIFMRQYYTPRLLSRLLAQDPLPKLPGIESINRVQPEVQVVKVEADSNHAGALRAVVCVKSQQEGAKSSGARDLRLFRDGQLVGFREGNLSDGEYVFDNIRLAHKGPKQEVMLTAYAFNVNLVKSETARAEPYKVSADWPERQGRVFLVNMGVNRTQAQGCDLHYTVEDAIEMQSMLTQRLQAAGYDVEQHLLTADDTQPNGASKSKLESVLREVAERATPDDLFMLSYSGHGYTDATGEFYLLPSDLKGDCDHPDQTLQDSAISSEDLTQWIRPIDAGEMVMILDACYSAASIESNDFKPGPMGSSGLGQLAYDKRIRVLAASQATQPAGEAGDLGMGYLSYVLTKKGLEQNKADWQPQDGSVWLREWLAYGVEEVPKVYGTDTDPKNTEKGVKVNRTGTISLQTPSLFDFRSDQDHGMTLQTTQ